MPEDPSERLEQMARELERDEVEARWDERPKKVAKAKSAPDKPEEGRVR